MNKIKIVWICHFSNIDVRSRLPLSGFWLKNRIKKILGKKNPARHNDFAPWVSNLIREFEKFEDVELHVISPHKGLKRTTSEFEKNGVKYHFFKPDMPFLHTNWPTKFSPNGKPRFKRNRRIVEKFLNRINPDIVNLIGSENPYYSITALDIERIPVFLSAQTVYTNPDRKKLSGECNKFRWDVELQIHKKVKYYGCGGRLHHDLIKKNNPNAIICKSFFPIQKPPQIQEMPKEYDFAFFAAGVTPKKGIEDALDALAIVKKQRTNISLNIIGMCSQHYKTFLENKIEQLGLKLNVIFNGFFTEHSDMFRQVKKSKFALLPVKLDVISGTIIEAMLLGLPLVTYATTGTPYLNKDGKTVLLADIGDIDTLAANMLSLLGDPSLADRLRIDAKAFVEREFDNAKSAERLLKNYRAVIDHYYHNKPIPHELLFDTNEFPLYSSTKIPSE